MNTGAGKLNFASGKQSQWIRFGPRGSPDIWGRLRPTGQAFYIEVKSPSGRLRPEQEQFLSQARADGAIAFVARSVDDVKEHLG